MIKTQIAAAGAGAYGMSYVGAVKALKESGDVPEKYVGCSMGSVVGSLWAAGIEPSHMPHVFNEMMSSYNMFIESVFSIWDLATIWGIVDTQAMQNVMKKYLPNSWDEFEFPFYCVSTDVTSHGIRIFGKGYNEDIPPYKAVVASATVAPFMAPTKANIGGKEHLLIDGGFLDSMPVKYLDKDACKMLISASNVNKIGADANIELASGYKKYNNLVEYMLGVYETMNKETTLSDLEGIDFDTLATGTVNVKHVFDFTHWNENIQAGYESTRRFLAEHKEVVSNGSNR